MKTTVILEFDHSKPIPDLANFAAQRAYTLPGVDNVRVMEMRAVEEVPKMTRVEKLWLDVETLRAQQRKQMDIDSGRKLFQVS